MKTRLSELEAEAEEPTNHKAQNLALWLVYSSASASDSDNLVFTGLSATESKAEWVFFFRLRRFDFHKIVSLYASEYDSDYDSVASENQP